MLDKPTKRPAHVNDASSCAPGMEDQARKQRILRAADEEISRIFREVDARAAKQSPEVGKEKSTDDFIPGDDNASGTPEDKPVARSACPDDIPVEAPVQQPHQQPQEPLHRRVEDLQDQCFCRQR